jgi:hypothetical protein
MGQQRHADMLYQGMHLLKVLNVLTYLEEPALSCTTAAQNRMQEAVTTLSPSSGRTPDLGKERSYPALAED